MLNSITASTSPVLVRYTARSRLVNIRRVSAVVTISSRFCVAVMFHETKTGEAFHM
jgi:hypothetical protein